LHFKSTLPELVSTEYFYNQDLPDSCFAYNYAATINNNFNSGCGYNSNSTYVTTVVPAGIYYFCSVVSMKWANIGDA